MSDVDSREKQLAIADEAARLLDDPLFNSVVSTILKDYIQELMCSTPGSSEAIVAHSGMRALNGIKERLTALKNNGAVLRKQGA